MKEKTHKDRILEGWQFLNPEEYAQRSRTSHVYVIRGKRDGNIIAVLLSCEQCPVVYLENLTYDIEYAKYSAGKMIYHYYLGRLAEKGKEELFLGGGNHDYKRRYGSIEETLYFGDIYRHGRFSRYYYTVKYKLLNKAKAYMRIFLPRKFFEALKAALTGRKTPKEQRTARP